LFNGLNCEQVGTSGQQRDIRLQRQVLGDSPRPRLCERTAAKVVVKLLVYKLLHWHYYQLLIELR